MLLPGDEAAERLSLTVPLQDASPRLLSLKKPLEPPPAASRPDLSASAEESFAALNTRKKLAAEMEAEEGEEEEAGDGEGQNTSRDSGDTDKVGNYLGVLMIYSSLFLRISSFYFYPFKIYISA